jgi:hypothetical protein
MSCKLFVRTDIPKDSRFNGVLYFEYHNNTYVKYPYQRVLKLSNNVMSDFGDFTRLLMVWVE